MGDSPIDTLRMLLGPNSEFKEHELKSYLSLAKGSLDAAAEMLFTEATRRKAMKRLRNDFGDNAVPAGSHGWPKLLGSRVVSAESTISGRSPVSFGQKLKVERRTIVKRGGKPQPARKRFFAARDKRKQSEMRDQADVGSSAICRVQDKTGRDIGRLNPEVNAFLAPLIDADVIRCECTVNYIPQTLSIFTPFLVELKVYVKSAELFEIFGNPDDDELQCDEFAKKHRYGLLRDPMFKLAMYIAELADDDTLNTNSAVGTRTPIKTVAKQKRLRKSYNQADNSNVIDLLGEDSNGAANDTIVTNIDNNDNSEGYNSDATTAAASPGEDPLLSSGAVEELLGTVDDSRLSASAVAGPSESPSDCTDEKYDLEELLGDSLTITLRPYQERAVRWMMERENTDKLENQEELNSFLKSMYSATTSGKTTGNKSNPLWSTHCFAQESTCFYVNTYSRRLSLTPPAPIRPCRGGILADEMGMGKTIMLLSLIVAQANLEDSTPQPRSENISGPQGSTLIVCQTSLLGQWREELSDKVKGIRNGTKKRKLRVLEYYGSDRGNCVEQLCGYDVVITTYGVLSSEMNGSATDSKQSVLGKLPKTNGPQHALFKIQWDRVVLDEAHYIKNKSTGAAKSVCAITARRRWCMTGTPIQNSIEDLFSLIQFLKHSPWDSISWWTRVIREPHLRGDAVAVERLRFVLADGPLMLRRTKDMTDLDGKQIVGLPPKHVHHIELDLNEAERRFYDALFSQSKMTFDGMVAAGTARNKYAQILSLLLRLRQACDHPLLVLGRGGEDNLASSNTNDISPYLIRLAKKYIEQLESGGSTTNAAVHDPTTAIHAACAAAESVGQPTQHLKRTLENLSNQEAMKECPVCFDKPTEPVITVCGHITCRECLVSAMNYFGNNCCPTCRTPVNVDDVLPVSQAAEAIMTSSSQEEGKDKDHVKKEDNTSCIAEGAVKLTSSEFRRSTKLTYLVLDIKEMVKHNENLKGTKCEDGTRDATPDKALVFSQWTTMLDMCERVLTAEGIRFVRLDGTLAQKKREQVIQQFSTDDSIIVFLISLKAGGVGLNLTAANRVYHLDPWWNPSVQEQATQRAHRIGQTKPVIVKHLLISDTVEQKLLKLQAKKKELATQALSVDGAGSANRNKLTFEDLQDLFA